MTGLEVYQLFQALRLHFTTDSYNVWKYNFKVKSANADTFSVAKGKYFYEKLARKFPEYEKLLDFLVANFMANPNIWIADLLDSQANENYLRYISKFESLSYNFKQDVIKLVDKAENNCSKFFQDHENWQWFQSELPIETIVILNSFIHFIDLWDKKCEDTILWPNFKQEVEKLSQFILIKVPNMSTLEDILQNEMRK